MNTNESNAWQTEEALKRFQMISPLLDESRYDHVPESAKEEYENEPPSDYYREGYNLYL